MDFTWLKKFTPRGLYGRAAMILLVPVIVIQLTVVVAFSQRYFNDITQQLMAGIISETALYIVAVDELDATQARAVIADLDARFGVQSQWVSPEELSPPKRAFLDFSGRVVERELRAAFPNIESIWFDETPARIAFTLPTREGLLVLSWPRARGTARNPHQLLVLTMFTGVVIALISIVFLRNQLRPIRRLARAAEAFGRGEILPYRLAGASEVRSAGAAFLNMRTRIERQIEQRTMMLSGVSHDLRTPLTRMRLALSMMEPDTAATGEELAALRTDLDEMEVMLNTFLDFASHDAVEISENVDLVALVRGACDNARRAGGDVTLTDVPAEPLEMALRPQAISRSLDNLLVNAKRYATKAHVSVVIHERSVVIAVEDDGPGIAPTDRERAMSPFERLDDARNQNRGSGVGLGLAIAVDVARKHGGSLRLDDSAQLGGLRASLVLPL